MDELYKMAISLFRKKIEQGVVTDQEIKAAMLEIDKAIDKAIIAKHQITDLLKLRTDIQILSFH